MKICHDPHPLICRFLLLSGLFKSNQRVYTPILAIIFLPLLSLSNHFIGDGAFELLQHLNNDPEMVALLNVHVFCTKVTQDLNLEIETHCF